MRRSSVHAERTITVLTQTQELAGGQVTIVPEGCPPRDGLMSTSQVSPHDFRCGPVGREISARGSSAEMMANPNVSDVTTWFCFPGLVVSKSVSSEKRSSSESGSRVLVVLREKRQVLNHLLKPFKKSHSGSLINYRDFLVLSE